MAKKILIVEDEEILRNAYVSIFHTEKFTVSEASNGKEALGKIKSFQPDIILLDILMPIMNGLEFLKIAQIKESHPNTKVLVLSNLSDKGTIDSVLLLGATSHLVKANISPRQLVNEVKDLLTS